MKKGIIIFGVLALSSLNSTWGQLASRIRAYSETSVSDVHLQVYKSSSSTLLYYKESQTNRDVFIYNNKKYVMPIFTNPYGSITYSVNDMIVAGDCCFFCGKLFSPNEPPIYPPILDRSSNSSGYIACLYLDSIDDPYNPNVRCRFSLIDNTSEMTKMAIYSYSGDTAIAMIGKDDSPDRFPCLVSVTGTGSSWQNRVHHLFNATETLTDIALTDKSLVTTSCFEGDTTTFGVRYDNLFEFFNNNDVIEYVSLHKFDPQNLLINPPSPPATAWHRNNATIRIVAVPFSNDVIVGQECHYFNGPSGSISSYINLYQIDGSIQYHVMMTKALRTYCMPDNHDVFYDMLYIPPENKIAILQKHPTIYNGLKGTLSIVSLNNNTGTLYQSNSIIMSAMDIAANKYVWIGGINKVNNTIAQACQDITIDYNSCLKIDYSDVSTLTPLPNAIQSTTVFFTESSTMLWQYISRVVPSPTYYNIECKKTYDK